MTHAEGDGIESKRLYLLRVYKVTVTSCCLQHLRPPCWRYTVLRWYNVVNLRMIANCCVCNYTPLEMHTICELPRHNFTLSLTIYIPPTWRCSFMLSLMTSVHLMYCFPSKLSESSCARWSCAALCTKIRIGGKFQWRLFTIIIMIIIITNDKIKVKTLQGHFTRL